MSDFDYETPEAVAQFERIWRGEATGFGEVFLTGEIAGYERTLAGLRAGTVPSRKVIRGGRKVAEKWLLDQITKYREGLATRGRSIYLNQRNVAYHLSSEDCSRCGERHYRTMMRQTDNGWLCLDTDHCDAYVAHRVRYPKTTTD